MIKIEAYKKIIVALALVFGIVWAVPNILPEPYKSQLPSFLRPVNLGLDLRGGSHLVLEVKIDEVLKEQTAGLSQSVRQVLREKKVRFSDLKSENDFLTVKVASTTPQADAMNLIRQIDPNSLDVKLEKDNTIRVAYNDVYRTQLKKNAVNQSIEIVRRRIDESGTKEPSIQAQGENRIVVQLPGVENPEMIKMMLGKTAKLSFHLVDEKTSVTDARQGRIGADLMLVQGADNSGEGAYVVQRIPVIGGDHLVRAEGTFDKSSGQPVVFFKFDTFGAKKFGKATSENVGNLLAIVLDKKVISAPRINSAITGGEGTITGNFTIQSAHELGMLLSAGALPAPLEVLEERTVGPGLGTDSIEAGKMACSIAVVFVMVFMLLIYGKWGAFADIALVMNLVLLFAVLSFIGATLTLPGIAGIALSLGMAVDANILIYERMREEERLGNRSPLQIIEAGYKNAFLPIVDSNLTTLAAGLVLFMFGAGPVRGFAVTLGIGIIISMFTAVLGSRVIISAFVNRFKPKTIKV